MEIKVLRANRWVSLTGKVLLGCCVFVHVHSRLTDSCIPIQVQMFYRKHINARLVRKGL